MPLLNVVSELGRGAPEMIGETIAHYQVTAKIGEGRMGEVHRATDTRLGREVALKVAKEQFSERFEREAQSIAQLNHLHICQLHDVGPNYLVMELVEGTPLKGPLPLRKAIIAKRQTTRPRYDRGVRSRAAGTLFTHSTARNRGHRTKPNCRRDRKTASMIAMTVIT
jgi:serine/threonine protein kinase